MKFNKINNLTGWVAFGIALVTYLLTVERTASFWDCGEFIACSFKLQVPHPPGAPLFLLIGRLFSMLALGDVTQVAYWVNMVSVLSSAFTILFLFWTITLLGRKLLDKKDEELTTGDTLALMGAGLVGALAYTWSDSFWFSAVEAEVYGLSSFFTAIVICVLSRLVSGCSLIKLGYNTSAGIYILLQKTPTNHLGWAYSFRYWYAGVGYYQLWCYCLVSIVGW